MKWIRNSVLLLFIGASVASLAQDDYVIDKDSLKVKDRISYDFTMGAGFGYSSNAGEFFSTYYSPSITYDVTSRFALKAGFTYANGMVNNYPVLSRYGFQPINGNINQYYTYVAGEYMVNERLIVGGSIFYDMTEYTNIYGESYNNAEGLSRIGYSGYFEYKLSNNMSILGEIRVNDRSPFRNSFFGGPQYSVLGR